MKSLLYPLLLVILFSCSSNAKKEEHVYRNVTVTIVYIKNVETRDGTITPISVTNYDVIIRNVKDTTQYGTWEFNKDDFYKHRLNDTLHFEYILKKRFFKFEK